MCIRGLFVQDDSGNYGCTIVFAQYADVYEWTHGAERKAGYVDRPRRFNQLEMYEVV